MPAEYSYDPAARLLSTRMWGVVTIADVMSQICLMRDDARIGPGTRQLVDLTQVERIDVPADALRAAARSSNDLTEKFRGHRIAMAAPSDVAFGMARMYEMLSSTGGAPPQVEVFRTREEAAAWLAREG